MVWHIFFFRFVFGLTLRNLSAWNWMTLVALYHKHTHMHTQIQWTPCALCHFDFTHSKPLALEFVHSDFLIKIYDMRALQTNEWTNERTEWKKTGLIKLFFGLKCPNRRRVFFFLCSLSCFKLLSQRSLDNASRAVNQRFYFLSETRNL